MKKKVIIVGGGPVGMYAAMQLDDYLLIDANKTLGGQLTRLYPEKNIVDIPEFECIKADDYITYLGGGISCRNLRLDETVLSIEQKELIEVKTDKDTYQCEYLIVATGLGFSTPRKLEIAHADECSNILYSLKDYSFLKNKKVAILGGGDSAIDWAEQLVSIAQNVYLIHRRNEFRGDISRIEYLRPYFDVLTPYVPYELEIEDGKATTLIIQKVGKEDYLYVPVDYILVNYGNIVSLSDFNLKKENGFFVVDENYQAAKNIFVVGDASTYPNKKRRIAPGNSEVDKILKLIK